LLADLILHSTMTIHMMNFNCLL